MPRLYACIVEQHDPRLVALALAICLIASYAAVSLVIRAAAAGRYRHWWLSGVAVAIGGGIWSTHFVAMLAFQPGLPVAYDPARTAISLLVAIGLTGLGFAAAVYCREKPGLAVALGGMVIGIGVFVMHVAGMAATILPATMAYDPPYAAAALAIGVLFSALTLLVVISRAGLAARLTAATLLAAGIGGLHFIAMAGLTLHPDPTAAIPDSSVPTDWMAAGIALATLLVLGVAMISALVDQRLGARAEREAAWLRLTVAELHETRQRLEATTVELRSALQAASASSEAKSKFLAAMSHELRTPLNAVLGFSQALGGGYYGALNERQKEYLGHIHAAGEHLLKLVNDVLDLSKMDADRLTLDETVLDIGELATSAIGMFTEDALSAGVTLKPVVEDNLPALRVDERRIRQVLINLLSNAIKFTPAGGSVALHAFRRGPGVAIAVRDTGIGIAADDIPRALERFGQVDNRLARRYEGTGLGLPLSKQLIELHDGTLEIESVPGIGTTVTVTFPGERLAGTRRAA